MAGISFELKRLLKSKKFSSLILSFAYSVSLSAGPWIISIFAILIAGFLAGRFSGDELFVRKCEVVVTYVTALSLILSSPLQLLFSRYVADRIFEKEIERILPNFLGALFVNMGVGFFLSVLTGLLFLKELSSIFVLLFSFLISLFCGFWIATTLLSSLKSYKYVFFSFLLGFSLMIILAIVLQKYFLLGFLFAYFTGAGITFSLILFYMFRSFPSNKLLEFDFLKKGRVFFSLALVGLFYNLGIWIDKFLFWFSPSTGDTILGPFRASFVYDVPMFLAYLSIAPGMGFFFLKLEGEFDEYYQKYYEAVRGGETFGRILEVGYEMVMSVRSIIQEVFRIQAMAVVIVFLVERGLFKLFKLSSLYIPLFNILSIGTTLQLLFMVVLSLLFYFDLRKEALISTFTFFLFNGILTYLSIKLGPYFYGYGFSFSLLVTFVVSLILLRRVLREIHFRTFMLSS